MASYRYFTNRDCEFYPCHKTDRLNCLFCYCPLYFLDCGGNCTRTSRGLKDCSDCLLPHTENGYDYIVQKLTEVAARCQPDPNPEADTGPDPEPGSEQSPEPGTGPKPEPDTGPDPETGTKPDSNGD